MVVVILSLLFCNIVFLGFSFLGTSSEIKIQEHIIYFEDDSGKQQYEGWEEIQGRKMFQAS